MWLNNFDVVFPTSPPSTSLAWKRTSSQGTKWQEGPRIFRTWFPTLGGTKWQNDKVTKWQSDKKDHRSSELVSQRCEGNILWSLYAELFVALWEIMITLDWYLHHQKRELMCHTYKYVHYVWPIHKKKNVSLCIVRWRQLLTRPLVTLSQLLIVNCGFRIHSE